MDVRVQENLPRTNSIFEGWHHRFAGSIPHVNPHIWTVIEKRKESNSLNDMKMV